MFVSEFPGGMFSALQGLRIYGICGVGGGVGAQDKLFGAAVFQFCNVIFL